MAQVFFIWLFVVFFLLLLFLPILIIFIPVKEIFYYSYEWQKLFICIRSSIVDEQLVHSLKPLSHFPIYTTIAHKLLKVKFPHHSSGQFCYNSMGGAFFNLVRLNYDVCSTMYDVFVITGRVVAIHARIWANK